MTEFVNETKLYKDFIFTAEGRSMLRQSINIKKQWKEQQGDITIETAGVKLNLISPVLRKKIKKIKITPIGLNNQCHRNAQLFNQCGYTSQLGFNITACPCGRKIGLELHSVNKKDGVFYDFTRDFNDETEKYFLPLDVKATANKYVAVYGNTVFDINRGCKCNIEWTDSLEITKITQSDFIEFCKDVEDNLDRIKVWS